MATAPGYAHIVCTIKHSAVLREAAVTWGVNPTETDADSIAGGCMDAFNVASGPVSKLDSGCTIGPVTCYLGTDGSADIVGVDSRTFPGGTSRASIHPGTALLVTKRTARGGRRGKGRMFIPWALSTGEPDEAGIVLTATITAWNTALQLFRAQLSSFSMPMVVLHKPSPPGTEHSSTMGAPDLVTSLVASNLVSSQRRRLGRG